MPKERAFDQHSLSAITGRSGPSPKQTAVTLSRLRMMDSSKLRMALLGGGISRGVADAGQ
jgi:hypothetical protein